MFIVRGYDDKGVLVDETEPTENKHLAECLLLRCIEGAGFSDEIEYYIEQE
jgi:hypothetical protein